MPDEVTNDRGVLETEVVVDESEKAFEDGFKEATAEPTKEPEIKETEVKEEEVKEEEVKEEEKVAKAEIVEVAEEPKKVVKEDEGTYKQRFETLKGILRHDTERFKEKEKGWEAEKAKLVTDLEEAKTPKQDGVKAKEPTGAEAAAAEAFVESLTPEQKAQLDQYEAEFDIVSKMEGIKRKVELAKLRKEMLDNLEQWKTDFTKEVTSVKEQIQPAIKVAAEREGEVHFDIIRNGYRLDDGTVVEGHPDFEKYRAAEEGGDGSLINWINSKSPYMRDKLMDVYNNGTAIDAIDLITDFKNENKISPSKVSNVRSMKRAALMSVPSRPAAISTGRGVSEDYDGAFDEALRKTGG